LAGPGVSAAQTARRLLHTALPPKRFRQEKPRQKRLGSLPLQLPSVPIREHGAAPSRAIGRFFFYPALERPVGAERPCYSFQTQQPRRTGFENGRTRLPIVPTQ